MKNDTIFSQQFAVMCKVIVHPTRMRIFEILGEDEANVSEIQKQLHISMSNLSNHLRELHSVGILSREKRSNFIYYRLTEPKLVPALRKLKEVVNTIASKISNQRMED
jgi:DNA-binding transcriptional ArsR family regulator